MGLSAKGRRFPQPCSRADLHEKPRRPLTLTLGVTLTAMNLHAPQGFFLAGLTAYLIIRSIYQRRSASEHSIVQRSSSADRLLVFLVVLGQVILPVVYVFSPWLDRANYDAPQGAAWSGAITWLAGMWLFWRSHADLGKNWSVSLVLRQDHRLVTNGVYRVVRHPMYSSFLLFGAAQAQLLPNWLAGFSALLAVVLMCLFRTPHEEAMMLEHFGDEYREYVKRTSQLIPRLVSLSGRANGCNL